MHGVDPDGIAAARAASDGIAGDTRFQLRAPAALIDAIDMVKDCRFTATNLPLGIFAVPATSPVAAQLDVFASSDITMVCPAPGVKQPQARPC